MLAVERTEVSVLLDEIKDTDLASGSKRDEVAGGRFVNASRESKIEQLIRHEPIFRDGRC